MVNILAPQDTDPDQKLVGPYPKMIQSDYEWALVDKEIRHSDKSFPSTQ